MRQLEILANEIVAERLNKTLEVVPMTGEKNQPKPANGAHVLIHSWEPEDVEGEEGYDVWEVVRWFKAGTVVEAGIDTRGSKSESKIIRALKGKKIHQTIGEDGFYWRDSDDYEGPNEWHRIANGNIDCWCELTGTGKGKMMQELRGIASLMTLGESEKGEEPESEDDSDGDCDGEGGCESHEPEELMFKHEFRLFDGTAMEIKTIPSSEWKDGKRLPDDVGAFAWRWRNKDGSLIKKGELSARFPLPEDGEDWDTVDLAEQVLRYVLERERKIKNPDGAYALIG